jgi:acyl-homoserine-lactone acylase
MTEILWDSWGIPHINAENVEDLFWAMGWAQMQSHGNLILRLYGQARGQASEYWGESYLDSDKYVRTMGVPMRSQQWYQSQNSAMQSYLASFAAGVNTYAQRHTDKIDDEVKVVLPINGIDIIAHIQRVIHFHFLVDPQQIALLKESRQAERQKNIGSNAWVIAPAHSASGNAMLLANPHLPWSDLFLWYEAHLIAPGLDAYGAALVGWPLLAIAFNDHISWTVTVNTFKGADFYELKLTDGGYCWDGGIRAFETETQILKIKQADGSLHEETLTILYSIHGPVVIQESETAYALRVVGLDEPFLIEQLWEMNLATNLDEFETALKRLQLPLFNFLYADRMGQILYLFNAQLPVRSPGDWDYWLDVIPGDTSDTLWSRYHAYEDLPRVLNPPSGWLQNTNDPPWTTTVPSVLTPSHYPPYLSPPSLGKTENIFRPQRSIRLLIQGEKMSFEQMIACKFSAHLELADRLVADLIEAAQQLGGDLGQSCAEVLASWDGAANADSRGAVLFSLWEQKMQDFDLFAEAWNEDAPMNTPRGLADPICAVEVLESVASEMKSWYGKLDVTWGEVVRMQYGTKDLPASGASGRLGSFRVLDVVQAEEGYFQVVAGDTYIAAVEFSQPIRAEALMTYGNATQLDSLHIADQLTLYAQGKLRPIWRTRQDITAHLESYQVF